jgi:thiosulfate reductase cytochrome b subunit
MEKIYVHPLPVRIWHWSNMLFFVLLILTGLQIRYVGSVDVIPFRAAVLAHNFIGFLLIGSYAIWLVFYLLSDKKKAYHPIVNPMQYFRESFAQIRYYGYGIFVGEPSPHHVSPYHKFNPLQLITYQVIMLILLPLQIYTGLLMWDAELFSSAVAASGGLRVLDTVHVLVFIVFVGYILVHPYLASLGHTPTAHYKAMFTGYEEVEKKS